jgi:hypothetical protein
MPYDTCRVKQARFSDLRMSMKPPCSTLPATLVGDVDGGSKTTPAHGGLQLVTNQRVQSSGTRKTLLKCQ